VEMKGTGSNKIRSKQNSAFKVCCHFGIANTEDSEKKYLKWFVIPKDIVPHYV